MKRDAGPFFNRSRIQEHSVERISRVLLARGLRTAMHHADVNWEDQTARPRTGHRPVA
jgi:hypothetical protein